MIVNPAPSENSRNNLTKMTASRKNLSDKFNAKINY